MVCSGLGLYYYQHASKIVTIQAAKNEHVSLRAFVHLRAELSDFFIAYVFLYDHLMQFG